MGDKPTLLAEKAPKFWAKGGHFFVDVGIANAPILAFTPADMLKAISRARAVYEAWDIEQRA